jgi:hypothetical protein
MQKMTSAEILKYKIEEIEYQINEDFLILKEAFIHMEIKLSYINIIKYTGYIMLNAWLPMKGKQMIALALNIYKVIVK